jgi:hypothetical protein
MKVEFDEKYEQIAAEFQYEQILLLKATLERHGIARDLAKKICGDFSFDLAMLFDQGEIVVDGEAYAPCLAFTADDETLYAQPPEIEYHEYAFGTTAEAYENE